MYPITGIGKYCLFISKEVSRNLVTPGRKCQRREVSRGLKLQSTWNGKAASLQKVIDCQHVCLILK